MGTTVTFRINIKHKTIDLKTTLHPSIPIITALDYFCRRELKLKISNFNSLDSDLNLRKSFAENRVKNDSIIYVDCVGDQWGGNIGSSNVKISNNNSNYTVSEYGDDDDDEINVFWIDEAVDDNENVNIQNHLKKNKHNLSLDTCKDLEDIKYKILSVEFKKTYIITSPSMYDLVLSFLDSRKKDIKFVPEVIIYSTNSQNLLNIRNNILQISQISPFVSHRKSLISDPKTLNSTLKRTRNYRRSTLQNIQIPLSEDVFTFEDIKTINDLILPVKLADFIEGPSYKDVKCFNKFVINKFGDNNEVGYLLNQLLLDKKIPEEILVKYWLRLYTLKSHFYEEMNKYLLKKMGPDYDIYIKALYFGLKKGHFKSHIEDTLYSGSIISLKELQFLKSKIKDPNADLPAFICYCKSFLSTSLEKEKALEFMFNNKEKLNENNSLVLYQIKKGTDFDKENASNAYVREFSKYKNEKECLFFPFSSFEVGEIREEEGEVGKYFHVFLTYLGKYRAKIPEKAEIKKCIPETSFAQSLFTSQIFDKKIKVEMEKMVEFEMDKYLEPKYEINQIMDVFEKEKKEEEERLLTDKRLYNITLRDILNCPLEFD